MSHWDGLLHRLRVLLRPAAYDRELSDEQAFHLEMQAAHFAQESHGQVSTNDARHRARKRYGNIAQHKEEVRTVSGLGLLETTRQDLHFAWRSFCRTPAFTIVAVATLALGIGGNTAIFSALDALLFRPLPFAAPDELMKVSLTRPANGDTPPNDDALWSHPKFIAFRDAQQIFNSVSLHTEDQVTLRVDGDAERIRNEVTDSKYFVALGVQPVLGRIFAAEEDSIGEGRPVVILSHALWLRRFNGDSAVVGRTLDIGGVAHSIIGVMPAGFKGMSGRAELWMPLVNAHPWAVKEAYNHSYTAIARLNPGVIPAAAKAAVLQLGAIVDRAYPVPENNSQKHGAIARELDATRVAPQVRRSLYIMIGAVGMVLLIACANVANLFRVRATSRVHEIAVRMAIGATRRRLVRQLVTESMLLSLLGGIAGVGLAWSAVQVLSSLDATRAFNVRNLGGVGAVTFEGIRIDQTALVVAAVLTVLTGLLFGVLPALNATRATLNQQLKNGRSTRFAHSAGSINSRNVLVAVEIALAVVLLAGSGLMIRSLDKLNRVSPGFDSSNMLTFRLNVREGSPPDSMTGFYDMVVQRLAALPGVVSATAQDCPPLNGGCNGTSLVHRDRPPVEEGSEAGVGVHWIAPNWHKVMGVPLLEGRAFDSGDRVGNRKVVLINQTAATRLWPGQDPIGKPVSVAQGGFWNDTAYVVGIVGDLRYVTIDSAPTSDVYLSHLQSPRGRMMLVIRTNGNAEALVPAVRQVMRDIAPGLPVYDVRTMESRVADSTAYARFTTLLLALFAAVALGLATLGTYGVIAFSVSQRTRELGIRMALGALPGDVVRMVVLNGIAVAAAGAVTGLVVAVSSTRVLQSLLYEVAPTDPLTFVLIVALLMVAVAIASWVPARRAARVPPTVALRNE